MALRRDGAVRFVRNFSFAPAERGKGRYTVVTKAERELG